jgi:hypothetical protein
MKKKKKKWRKYKARKDGVSRCTDDEDEGHTNLVVDAVKDPSPVVVHAKLPQRETCRMT